MKTILHFALFVQALMVCLLAQPSLAQTTAFSYQGRLTDAGMPASGLFDFRLSIHNADPGGSQIGVTLTNVNVLVTNGVFSLMPDFGAGVFTGGARWLEIGVRPGGSAAAFTTLSPRQPVNATPYAQTAFTVTSLPAGTVGTSQLLNNSVGTPQLSDGSVTMAKLANGSVGTAHLQDGAVTTAKLALGAVTSSQLADGTITTNKLAPSTLAALGALPSGTMLFSDSTNGALFQSAGYQPVPGYNLPLGGWAAVQVNSPKPEYEAFKVGWTGNEFIVGGLGPTPGSYGGISLFNPSTGMWRTGTTNGAPPYQNNSPNSFGGVWTGSEVFTFGKVGISGPVGFGRYNPATDTWGVLNTNGAPPIVGGDGGPIAYPVLVWSGSEAILFGNTNSGSAVGAAGRYHPVSNIWSAVSQIGFPQPSSSDGSRFAVWTGAEVFYLAVTGLPGTGTILGGLYSPTNNIWRSFNTVGAPTNGSIISAVVTTANEVAVLVPQVVPPATATVVGTKFYLFNPVSNTWRNGTTNNSPVAADSVFWTGTEIGVIYRTGNVAMSPGILGIAFYNPVTDVWRSIPWDSQHAVSFYSGAPGSTQSPLAVWTGLDVLLTGRIAATNSAGMATGTYPNELFRFTPIRTLLLYQRP